MKNRLLLLIPLALFLGLAVILYRGLSLDPTSMRSALLDRQFPAFSLPNLHDEQSAVTELGFKGPALVNVWATWCPTCRAEHEMLNKLADAGVVIYGINYKDDSSAARQWLQDLHDPYRLNVVDAEGKLGFDLGVYGAPETFLIDADGVIRHKFVGAIDERAWRTDLAPRYQALVEDVQ